MNFEVIPWTESDRLKARNEEIRRLCADINDIHDIYKDLSSMVGEQQSPIEQMLEQAEQARSNTEKGMKHLVEAKTYYNKSTAIKITVGLCIGGPMGALIGIKTAVIGATVGAICGHFI